MDDAGSVTCGVMLFALVVGLILLVLQQGAQQRRLRAAEGSYRESLELLKRRPGDPDLRQKTLALGRKYSNLTRGMKGVTIYDEVALLNDISAASAAVLQAPGGLSSGDRGGVEVRLTRLKELLTRGIITDAEYEQRRSKLLDEL